MRVSLDPVRLQQEQTQQLLRAPKPIDVVQIQSTTTTIFTAGATSDFRIESLIAENMTAGATTLTVYLVPSGGTPGASNTIVFSRPIPASSRSYVFDGLNIGFLQPGMSLRALCAVNNDVNMFGWGYDYFGANP